MGLRKFRESQFLDTLRGRSMSPKRQSDEQEEDMDEEGRAESQPPTGNMPSKAEAEVYQKSYEQQERQKRHAEREDKRKQEEAKKGKLQDLKGKDPNAAEALRIRQRRALERDLARNDAVIQRTK